MANNTPNKINIGLVTQPDEATFYNTLPPTLTAGYKAGDTWIVTPLGTQADANNATATYRFDGQIWVKTSIGGATVPTGQNVYIDTQSPSTGTIFDTANPPVTNNNALKEDSANTYYGTDGSVWVWNGTNYVTKVYSFPIQQLDNDIIATANQTAFVLNKIPVGNVWMYRNGVRLGATAISWVGKNVTYIPANNGAKTIDALDRISFEYEAY